MSMMMDESPANRARVRVDAAHQGMAKPEDVNYREAEDPAMSCGSCLNFDGGHSCAKVAGEVDAAAVCDLYEATEPMMEEPVL